MKADNEDIEATIKGWYESLTNGPVEQVMSYLTEDAVVLIPGRTPLVGKPAIKAALSSLRGVFVTVRGMIRDITVDGNTANCWTDLSVIAIPSNDGKTIHWHGNGLIVLKKRTNSWAISRECGWIKRDQK